MDEHRLNELCWASGITTQYGHRDVPDDTKRRLLAALGVSETTTPEAAGVPDFHRPPDARCALPDWLEAAPTWGLFCQLYELRSANSWGIGDFGDLARLARVAGAAGADFLGVNPVHALFLAEPSRCSPFMPSNRAFLNPLYIAMDDLPGRTRPDKAALAAVEAAELVDYDAVAALKLKGLNAVFSRTPFDDDRFPEVGFAAFRRARGEALDRHALFETLSLHMVAEGHGAGWHGWPDDYQRADSPAVAAFAKRHVKQLRFHAWLQWIACLQLDTVQEEAHAAGMRIGLYLDLAVGEALDGSATWGMPGLALEGVVVGAPPDVFSQEGQNWDLAALNPVTLAASGYAPLRALIRAQLDHAGALRIDHVMVLRQLFLIPDDALASAGTHMAYPFAEMLRVVAEESLAHGAVMIGEDLGWVPHGFRETMQEANILAYRILYFEQEFGLFRRAATYPKKALACISTHDLPTLTGWWAGEDIAQRREFGLIDDALAKKQEQRRIEERTALVNALIDGGQLPPDARDGELAELPPRVLEAAYRFLGAPPSRGARGGGSPISSAPRRRPTCPARSMSIPTGAGAGRCRWRKLPRMPVSSRSPRRCGRCGRGARRRSRRCARAVRVGARTTTGITRRLKQLAIHQPVDEQAEKLAAAAHPGLAVDRVGLGFHRALRGVAQPGDLVGREPLDGKQRHVAFGRGEAPIGKRVFDHVHEGRRRQPQPCLGGLLAIARTFQRQRAEHEAQNQADAGADLNDLAHLPRDRLRADADIGRQDVREEKHGADGLNHQSDRNEYPITQNRPSAANDASLL
jgi:4-alpha-glucanotransferase